MKKIQRYLAGILCGVMLFDCLCGTQMQTFAMEEAAYTAGDNGGANRNENVDVSLSGNDDSAQEDAPEILDASGVDGESVGGQMSAGVSVSENDGNAGEDGLEAGDVSDLDDEDAGEQEDGGTAVSVSANDIAQEEAAFLADGSLADNILTSGTYENITWTIDLDGKLTVEGSGEFSIRGDNSPTRAPWHDWGINGRGYIKTAEINVTDMKNLSYMFNGCSDLTYVDFSGSDLSGVTNMNHMFGWCTTLEGVNFGASEIRNVTNISMFDQCYALKSVDMSHFYTSKVTDMSNLFEACWALTSVEIGGLGTGNVTNMSRMFYGCRSLLSLNINEWDTSSVTDMSNMFSGCSSLQNLDVSGLDTSNVTDMSGMFYNCSGLSNLDVSGLDTSNVTDMSDMFYNCSKLSDLDLSGFHMENVTRLTGMFTNCQSLESVDISHFDMKGVTSLDNLFSGCSKLKNVSLACKGGNSITSISNLFSGCSSLTSVSLSGFDNNKITDMSRLFYGCRGLQSIDLNHFSTANVTNMSYMFSGCSGLTELNLDGFQASAAKNMSHMFEGCSKLEHLDVSSLSTANAEDMSYLFSGCYNLQSLDLAQLDMSKVTDMSHMFTGCSGLTELNLGGIQASAARDMSSMFSGCSKLEHLDLSTLSTANAGNMSYIFYGCNNLLSINLAQWDTSKVTDMSYMFSDCKSLKTLDTSGWVGDNVRSTEYMFYGCESLTALDLSSFGAGSLTTAEGMFQNCEAMKSLNLKGFKASKAVTMNSMFRECYSLESINLEGFDTSNVEDMVRMFEWCASLRQLDVSSFDTSHVQTMELMFSSCRDLEELDLSGFDTGKVTTMAGMLAACGSLKRLDVSGFDTSNVISMEYMFYSDAALKNLDIGSFDTANVRDMGGMFWGCRGLETIDVRHFDTGRVIDMTWMFNGCEELRCLDLGGFDMSSVKSADMMFFTSFKLDRIYTPRNVGVAVGLPYSTFFNTYNEVWYQADGSKIEQLPMNLNYSIVIEKNKKPAAQTARLEVLKKKKAYKCGEILNLDDLTVKYRDASGVFSVVTDYTTNASEIDMNVPGKKVLTVSCRVDGLTLSASVELTVAYVLNSQNVTLTVDDRDCVYDGTPLTPSVAVDVVWADGTKRALKSGEDYTVSYWNNINAYGNGAEEDNGSAPEARITGIGDYRGSVAANFQIRRAPLIITAQTCKVVVGEDFPGTADPYAYEVKGLFGKDTLIKEPVFTVTDAQGNETAVDTSKAGVRYRIMPGGADAGRNYDITYRSGVIVIVEDKASCTVLFKTEATQTNAASYAVYYDIAVGSLLEAPEKPEIAGYHFAGWYRDTGFLKPWDFETDTVQEDMTLYACMLRQAAEEKESGLRLCVQDIIPQTYTGSPVKPKVIVYAADGVTPLKAGRDYTIKYANNLAAVQAKEDGALPAIGTAAVQNPGKQETLQMLSGSFTKDCPYVIITGKGNYKETVYKNFYILPANIAVDGNMTLASGFTMKYADQLVKSNKKPQNPFTSLKYKKAMKLGTDYTLMLKANKDVTCDTELTADTAPQEWTGQTVYNSKNKKYTAPAIPAGYAGTFTLTVTGKGNYTGKAIRQIYVADDASGLMKNARITLGKNQKAVAYQKGGVWLVPGFYDGEQKKYYAVEDGSEAAREDGNDVFTVSVKSGGKTVYLKYSPKEADSDYFISYANHDRTGKATLTLSGNPKKGYFGSKCVTFKVVGTAFSAKTVDVKAYDVNHPDEKDWKDSIPYTGKAVTQNKVTLTTKVTQNNPTAQKLTYGEHYTITYKNHVKKGTATVTFTAKPESGYSGSFKKTFKITPQNLSKERLTVLAQAGTGAKAEAVYCKSGAQLPFVITNEAGTVLREGTDYTVKYKNNNAVTTAQTDENKKPLMTVTGKGNYAGKVEVPFTVIPASTETAIDEQIVNISCAQVGKKDSMKFKDFKFKLMEGKKTLGMGDTKDYIIDETNCTPDQIKAYAVAVAAGTEAAQQEPLVTVKGRGCYTGEKTISLGRYIYAHKLTAACMYVVVSEEAEQSTYTGGQVTPDVAVYYGEKTAVSAAKKDKVKEEETLTTSAGKYKLMKLTKDEDYTLSYGVNIAAGNNKGNVTVTGAGRYGGSVTVRFAIGKRAIY